MNGIMNYYRLMVIGLGLLLMTSCKDKLEELYINPDATTQASVEKFFTRMLYNQRILPEYWGIRTFALPHTAKYSQTASFVNGVNMYQQNLSYTSQKWNDYFTSGSGIVAHYREIEKAYNNLSEEDKVHAAVFYQAAKVYYYDETAQMIDLWGDLPFSQAGGLNLTGEVIRPKFDAADSVYTAIINDLDNTSNFFATTQLSNIASVTFPKQDILLKGNMDNWRRYSNSLKLRLLMKTSFVNESRAQTEVLKMLNDPSAYPLIDESTYNALLHPMTNYNENLRSAFPEVNGQFAPGFMLEEVMKPAMDPRIPVMFDKNGRSVDGVFIPNEEYNGILTTESAAVQEDNISFGRYAVLDSSTFMFNSRLPGIVFTSSEVNFLKAEAFERWGGGDAKEAYDNALSQSIEHYYYLNSLGTVKPALTMPAQEEIDNFLATATVDYSGSQEERLIKIWTQKWLHLGWMQSGHAWSELRRTNYPELSFQQDNSTPGESLPPSRLIYPNSEENLNGINYSKVADKDKPDVKVFWDVK